MWQKVARRVIQNWRIALLLILLISVFFLSQFKYLTYDNRVTQWVPQNDEVLKYSLEVGDKFRSNELVVVLFRPEKIDPFAPSVLQSVKQLTQELGQRKEIFLVNSIANSAYITQIEGGIEVRDFLMEMPEDLEAGLKLKEKALAEDSLVNNVISEDGQWLAFNVYINPDEDLVKTFGQVIKPLTEKYLSSWGKVYYSGIPADAFFADKFVTADIKTLVPLVILLILLVLYLSFRQWGGMFYPFLVVSLASIWIFGLMGLTRTPMNIITPALPVLLIALGSAYGIHVFNKLLATAEPVPVSLEQQSQRLASVALPVVLAAGTTMVGFISFLTARLKIIIQFGVFSSIGIAFAALLALIFIPTAQQLFHLRAVPKKEGISSIYSAPLSFLAKVVERRRTVILIVGLILLLAFFPGIFLIEHQVNFSEYYPADSPPRQALKIVKEKFGGSSPLSLYFKTDQVKSAAFLRIIRREGNYVAALSGVSRPFSIADFIQELNYKLNGSYALPETDGQVANLWFFIEGRRELEQLVTPEGQETLIMARVLSSATTQLKEIERQLSHFLEQEFSQKIVAVDLSRVPPEKRWFLRQQEATRLAEELGWITKCYTSQSVSRSALENLFLQALDNVPQLKEIEVKERIQEAWREYIYSDSFDFYLTSFQSRRLFSSLQKLVDWPPEKLKPEAMKIFRKTIPSEEFDPEIAEDVIATFLLRRQEVQREMFVERHLQALLNLLPIPEEAVAKDSLRKKAAGLLNELVDELVVLPQEKAEGEGQPIPLGRVIQTGYPSFITRLDYFLSTSQIQSLILALVLTFFLIYLLNRYLIWAFISIVPIVFSVVVIYGFLGLVGLPLDFATMMIASVSIGVGIDYVIHFSHGVKEALRAGMSLEKAVFSVYLEKGRAILANSLAVMMGFLVLLFSSMSPLANFGGMMAGAMLLSAGAALTILPALILWLKPIKGGQK